MANQQLSQQQMQERTHKIECQLHDAKQKLEVIKQTVFLSLEIESAKNAIVRINKFKFFRSGSKKQIDLKRQERKIDQYTIWGEIEKEKALLDSTKMILKLEEELLEMLPSLSVTNFASEYNLASEEV